MEKSSNPELYEKLIEILETPLPPRPNDDAFAYITRRTKELAKEAESGERNVWEAVAIATELANMQLYLLDLEKK